MSLKAMHENKKNNAENRQSNYKSEISLETEDLLMSLAEISEELTTERNLRIQLEQNNNSKEQQIKDLQNLLTELSKTSDNEISLKLSEQLKEKDKQILNEQEQNRQLKKELQDAAATSEEDKKANNKIISQLESDISRLERQLNYSKFDKVQYLKELESREKAVKEKNEKLDEHIEKKAYKIEQDTIKHYKEKESEFERKKAEYLDLKLKEYDNIKSAVEQQVAEHKAELDEQFERKQGQQERDYNSRNKDLESEWQLKNYRLENEWKSRNNILTGKFAITLMVGAISAIVTLFSVLIAFTHGLLPYIITDGKEIGYWCSKNWKMIFGQPFEISTSLPAILQFAIPLIFMIGVGIWTALDFDERKWVVFADKVSLMIIGIVTGISAVFSKQLNLISINTIMFPIGIYMIYVLIRFLEETGVLDKMEELLERLAKRWNGLEKNEKIGSVLVTVLLIFGSIMVINWFL